MVVGEHTAVWIDQFKLEHCRSEPIDGVSGESVERELKRVPKAWIVDYLHEAGSWRKGSRIVSYL